MCAACTIFKADSSLGYTLCVAGTFPNQPTNQSIFQTTIQLTSTQVWQYVAYNLLSRSIPEIHYVGCWDLPQPTNQSINQPSNQKPNHSVARCEAKALRSWTTATYSRDNKIISALSVHPCYTDTWHVLSPVHTDGTRSAQMFFTHFLACDV